MLEAGRQVALTICHNRPDYRAERSPGLRHPRERRGARLNCRDPMRRQLCACARQTLADGWRALRSNRQGVYELGIDGLQDVLAVVGHQKM